MEYLPFFFLILSNQGMYRNLILSQVYITKLQPNVQVFYVFFMYKYNSHRYIYVVEFVSISSFIV